jgi:hypothetical protein
LTLFFDFGGAFRVRGLEREFDGLLQIGVYGLSTFPAYVPLFVF